MWKKCVNVISLPMKGGIYVMYNRENKIIYIANYKSTLKKEKLTTRDSRAVERKKYGHRKARRSFQFSKR